MLVELRTRFVFLEIQTEAKWTKRCKTLMSRRLMSVVFQISHFCKKMFLVLKSRPAFLEWKNYLNNVMILKNCIYLYLIAVSKRRFCALDSQAGDVWGGQRGKIDFKTGEPPVGWLQGFLTVSFLQGNPKLRRKVCPQRRVKKKLE